MTQLNKIVASDNGKRKRRKDEVSALHHAVQRPNLTTGMTRTYQHYITDEQGNPEETLPPEEVLVQLTVDRVLSEARKIDTEWWDVAATREHGNTLARADVVVDGQVMLAAVPVGTLMFLEQRLNDWRVLLEKCPVLDPAYTWDPDETSGVFKSGEIKDPRTRLTITPVVLYPHTDKHPAQVEKVSEQRQVGMFTKHLFSGAMTRERRSQLLDRVEKLKTAVRNAREQANQQEVENQEVAEAVFSYLLAP